MWYQLYKDKVYITPTPSVEDPEDWPLAKLPLSDISVEDWGRLTEMVQTSVATLYHGKQEGKVSKQQVLSSMQRTLVVFLNSLME